MGDTIKRNKLFVLATDECGLNCAFCSYAESRQRNAKSSEDLRFPKIDLEKGYAHDSIRSLVDSAPITSFSGGGEPLLNLNMLVSTMKMQLHGNYIITTGIGLSIKKLEECFSEINDACKFSQSYCTIRVSIDQYHAKQINYEEKLSYILNWFLNGRWSNCNTLFFRTTFADKLFSIEMLRMVALKNGLSFACDEDNEVVTLLSINNVVFKLVMRPTIYPERMCVSPRYSIFEYLDIMDKLGGGHKYSFGMPQGCLACRACFSANMNKSCYDMDDLDITITATGDVFLYGAEISALGNIYNEIVTPKLIKERMDDEIEYSILRSKSIREVLSALMKNDTLRKEIVSINYPYAVIRNLMNTHKDLILSCIRDII